MSVEDYNRFDSIKVFTSPEFMNLRKVSVIWFSVRCVNPAPISSQND